MKLFVTMVVIATAILINHLRHFGLFKKVILNQDNLSCIKHYSNPLDFTYFNGNMLVLESDGVYTLSNQQVIQIVNPICFTSDNSYLYIAQASKIFVYTKEWIQIKIINIPTNFAIERIAVFGSVLFLTQKYTLYDIPFILALQESFSILQCDLDGNCIYNFNIQGVHLNGVTVYNDQLYVADTFKKRVIVYDRDLNLVDRFNIPGGPTTLVSTNTGVYGTVIPKLTELLVVERNKSLYRINQNLQELATFEYWYSVGMEINGDLVVGSFRCGH